MTTTRLILLLLMFISVSSCSKKISEKYFEITLTNSFKHQDFNEFEKLIITPEDLAAGLHSNSNVAIPGDKGLVEEYKKNYIGEYKTLFENIINQGEALGIDWNRIKFEDFLFNIKDPINGSGLHFMNCHINIRVKGENYCFYGIDAQEYKAGYKISHISAIKRGRLKEYIDSNNNPQPNL